MLDHLAAFTFFFKEKNWFRKLLIASLLTFTLIGMAPVLGWCVRIARRVMAGYAPLPPEDDWREYWKLGGQFALVNVVWLLPLLAASFMLYAPLLLIGRLPDETVLLVWLGVFTLVTVVTIVYSLFYIYFIPAMFAALARESTTRQAMDPLFLLRLVRPKVTGYTMVFLIVGLGLMTAVGMLAPLTLFLLTPAMLVYVSLVTAHYAGQLARPEGTPP